MRWLDEGVARGIITSAQRDQLAELAGQFERSAERPRETEAAAEFNWVSAAYVVGALLVLFALGWFLLDRWVSLGAGGVLAVTAGYAALFGTTTRLLDRRGFTRAASLTLMLVIGCVPLATWALLTLAGEWPLPGSNNPLLYYDQYISTRWLTVELTTILVALLILRRRRSALVALPIAIALWWVWYHLSRMFDRDWFTLGFERWLLLANGLILLGIAEHIERWQRRERAGPKADDTDYAQAFWVVGMIGFAVAYVMMWNRGHDWRHLLAPISAVVIALSLRLQRRVLFVFGLLGVFGYLAFLAGDVFRTGAAFPIILAIAGLGLILVSVWVQRRFPGLLSGRDPADATRPLPWSRVMAWLPAGFALAMALLALTDVAEEREQRAFRERLAILQAHSGSVRARNGSAAPLRRVTPSAVP